LSRNHREATGVWLRIAKQGSKVRSLTHAEALDSALCFGWIDAQKKPESASAWLQRFTPRGKRSIWSKLNRQKAMTLIECGRMRDSGLQEILRAKKDGRWEQAYDSPRNAAVPEDFQAALDKSARGKGILCHSGKPKPLCDSVPHSNGKESRDARAKDHRICRHAGKTRENTSVIGSRDWER
jgi:uncharacterized protein YdeI (YjbR/CyaY-like superfamily)